METETPEEWRKNGGKNRNWRDRREEKREEL